MNIAEVRAVIENYNVELVLGLIILNLLFLIVLSVQAVKNKRMRDNYLQFMKNAEGQSLEEKIKKLIIEAESNSVALSEIQKELDKFKNAMKQNLQRVGVVRYNAFSDMGSDLSYAVAILNEHGNGVVMSSVYGREDFRAYAKAVENGTSQYRLSEEEKKAIALAMGK
ncbi:MAG: hypothetical protein PWQ96_25 [Clostridia bacterium]|jgi:hypothetical protein|nr:hypothetical protein [Clostridiales bacterium]MDK2984383.1 hypothetical protein [Clostridia bacterium]